MASSELIKWGKANAMSELSLIKAAEMFVEAEQYENAAKMLYILPNEIRYFDWTVQSGQLCPIPLFVLISNSRFNPSVTDLLISIYTNLNNDEKVVQVLDESIEYQKKNSSDSANLVKMLRISGSFYFRGNSRVVSLARKNLETIISRRND